MNSATDFKSYFRAADHLQTAISYNRSDSAFAHNRGSIVYLIDTNVAEAFFRGAGASTTQVLRRFLTDRAADVCDRLTFRYIFSGALPGAESTALYLSQPHWNEALRRLTSIQGDVERDIEKTVKRNGMPTETQLIALRNEKNNPERLISKAEEIGLVRLIELVKKASTFKTRLTSAYGEPGIVEKIKGLDRLPQTIGTIDQVRTDDFREWSALLTQFRVHRSDRGDTENINADALTLATIEALYRECIEALGDDATIRFVFVTSDSAIIRAVDRRSQALAEQGIPNFVRHPLVYSPLLNVAAMYRGDAEDEKMDQMRQVFIEVQDAISKLYPFELPGPAGKKGGGTSRKDNAKWALHWDLGENMSRWSSAAETIAIANANMFVDEGENERVARELVSWFESDDVYGAASASVSRKISSIRENHERDVSLFALDRLVEKLRDEQPVTGECRAPLQLYGIDPFLTIRQTHLRGLINVHTPDALLSAISPIGKTETEVTEIVDKVANAIVDNWHSEPKVKLMAALIYMTTHAWDSASGCLDQILQNAEGNEIPALFREVRYCKALSLRMQLRSSQEVSLASRLLQQNMREEHFSRLPKSQVVYLRDSAEHSALLLSACIVQTIEQNDPATRNSHEVHPNRLVQDAHLQSQFDDEIKNLDSSLEQLENNFWPVDRSQTLEAGILGQVCVNRLGAELFRHYFKEKISATQPDLGKVYVRAMATLRDLDDQYPMPLMGQVYVGMAEAELGLQEDLWGLLTMLRNALKTRISSDKATVLSRPLAYGDYLEYNSFVPKLLDALRRRAEIQASSVDAKQTV